MRACHRMVVLSSVLLGLAASPAAASPAVEIRTLSTRADLASGGDILLEVRIPAGAEATALRVRVGNRDVTGALKADGRTLTGMVTGITPGRHTVIARIGDEQGARLGLVMHPASGPLFAGPQVQPWRCATEAAALGPAVDAGCSAAPRIEHVYRSERSGAFEAYDPVSPPDPADVATTTTDEGRRVPYVVRVEHGTVDRSIYRIAVLADPTRDGSSAAWNRKLFIPFGGSCRAKHSQTGPADIEVSQSAPDGAVLLDQQLARGYAVATTGLSVLGQNCNTVVSAEALTMLKERIAERLGPIRFTLAAGCSGGSIQQHTIADAYPGLLDGLLPSCSFPDLWSPVRELTDCTLLSRYFGETSPQLWLDPLARQAVSGSIVTTCVAFPLVFANVLDPGGNDDPFVPCDVPDDAIYDAAANPRGVRCTIQDYQRAIWGVRAGDGKAHRPLDNVGVQYGLAALQSGRITPEQFVDLNARIGGLDLDAAFVGDRMAADPEAVERAYRADQMVRGRGLADAAIIDLRGTGNAEVHTDHWSYATRARLRAANGTAANQVIWTSATDGFATVGRDVPGSPVREAFDTLDNWLTAVERDDSSRSRAVKIRANRPAAAVDACFAPQRIVDPTACGALYPVFSNPRMVAGEPAANDVVKCALQPLERSDYKVAFSDEQWARLRTAFPSGVCDWRAETPGRVEPLSWPTFADGPGGRAPGAAPTSAPFGTDASRLGLPAAGSCVRGGALAIRVPRFARTLRVAVGGRQRFTKRVRSGRPRRVVVRRLPTRPTRVRVTVRTGGGRTLTSARRYRACP